MRGTVCLRMQLLAKATEVDHKHRNKYNWEKSEVLNAGKTSLAVRKLS